MGQRLNIEIEKEGKTLANCYYHWSAYTRSALSLVSGIISEIDRIKNEDEQLRAIELLGTTEAGLTTRAVHYLYKNKKNFDLTKLKCIVSYDRSRGLIEVSEEDMENTRDYEEGRVTINLDEKVVVFDTFFLMSKEDYEEYHKKVKFEDLEEFPFKEIDCIPFDKVKEILEWFDNKCDNENKYNFRFGENEVIQVIE